MAVLLVGIAVMSLMLTVAMPVWHQTMQREKEAELVFRGTQYMRAIGLYQRRFGAGYPPNIEFLVQQKFLRKKYKDPMVQDGEFQVIPAGVSQAAGQTSTQAVQQSRGTATSPQTQQGRGVSLSMSASGDVTGPVAGVVSKSTEESIRLYNGRDHYNEWLFLFSGPSGGRGVGGVGGRGAGGRGQGGQPGPGGRGRGGADQGGRGGRGGQ